MARVEDSSRFGGEEDFGPYIGPDTTHYSDNLHHAVRSYAHQPNHWGNLKRLLTTKPNANVEIRWNLRRLMRRIRRP